MTKLDIEESDLLTSVVDFCCECLTIGQDWAVEICQIDDGDAGEVTSEDVFLDLKSPK
jgi:predicted RecA/RadA family phage recombinase